MKILQLNVWYGKIQGALLNYLRNNDFDVICLQEAVWSEDEGLKDFFATLDQIKEAARLNNEIRTANYEIEAFCGKKMNWGIAILSREKMVSTEEKLIYPGLYEIKKTEDAIHHLYKAQLARLESGVNIVNYHGYWLKTPLGDGETVKAMRNVVEMVKGVRGPLVMCGDFNIVYEAEAMRELDFLRDLTHENKVESTLSGLKIAKNVPCDHILVSDGIEVQGFTVEDKIVSDHKGLIAEISY